MHERMKRSCQRTEERFLRLDAVVAELVVDAASAVRSRDSDPKGGGERV